MPIGFDDGVGGPGFVPISFAPDVMYVITEPTTVTFTLTAPPGQTNPPLSLNFYESKHLPGPSTSSTQKAMVMEVLSIPNPPTPVWSDGVATFTLNISNQLISLLSSNQTLLTVVAQITGDTGSMGMCSVAVDFPLDSPDKPE